MDTENNRETPKVRRPYETPEIVSEHMFETRALACGKCISGPFPQFACGAFNYSGS